MLTITNLILTACFCLVIHLGARIGAKPRAFSVSESFVFGHWPFLYLNLLVLYTTGGFDWTTLDQFDPDTMKTAQLVVALGLTSFLAGGLFGVFLHRSGAANVVQMTAPAATTTRVGILLATVGLAATIPNVIAMAAKGPEARSTVLLALGHLLLPGGLLCYVVARSRRCRSRIRLISFVLFLAAIVVLSLNWSRRPIVVMVAAVLMLGFVHKRGYVERWIFAALLPLLLLLAIAGLAWRDMLVHGHEISQLTDIFDYYVNYLWLESSAFSALMLVIDTYGTMQTSGDASLLLPLVFWIPRAIFPAKPAAFDPGIDLGTPYSIGPSIYGEILVNVTVVGLVPFMILLGFFFKWIDLSARGQRLQGAAAALYVLLVLDAIFLVRGSFHTMFTPMLLHFFAPLTLFMIDKKILNDLGDLGRPLRGEAG